MLTKEQALANLGLEEVTLREQGERIWRAAQDAYRTYSERYSAVWDELVEAIDNDPRIAPLKAESDAKHDEWLAFEGMAEPLTTTVHDGHAEREVPIRCQLSGVVMTEGDHVLCDAYGTPVMLRAAAGLPPEDEAEDFQSEAA